MTLLHDEPTIYTITRQMLLDTGALIDVSTLAHEAGFKWPVAIGDNVKALINAIPDHLQSVASEDGRLWDVLWMAFCAIRRSSSGGSELLFDVILPLQGEQDADDGDDEQIEQFKLIAGPGDQGEPVITILLPDED